MLLPQSPAYHLLKNRLTSVADWPTSASAADDAGRRRKQGEQQRQGGQRFDTVGSKGIDGAAGASSTIDFRKLLKMYEELRRSMHGSRTNVGSYTGTLTAVAQPRGRMPRRQILRPSCRQPRFEK